MWVCCGKSNLKSIFRSRPHTPHRRCGVEAVAVKPLGMVILGNVTSHRFRHPFRSYAATVRISFSVTRLFFSSLHNGQLRALSKKLLVLSQPSWRLAPFCFRKRAPARRNLTGAGQHRRRSFSCNHRPAWPTATDSLCRRIEGCDAQDFFISNRAEIFFRHSWRRSSGPTKEKVIF